MNTETAKRERIDSLDHLRVYAAFTVLVGHAVHFLNKTPYYRNDSLPFYKQGSGPVIFMTVAAFIALYTDGGKFGSRSSALAFLIKRMLRITPLYWIFTTLWLFIALTFPYVLEHHEVHFWHVVCSYLYLPYPRVPDGIPRPVLISGWTLSFIAWFYVLFALCLSFRRWIGLTLALVVLITMCAAGHFFPRTEGAVAFFSDQYVIAFALGLAAVPLYGYLKNRGVSITLPWSIVGVCGIFALSWMRNPQRSGPTDLWVAVCAFCIVLVAALTQKLDEGGIFSTTWGILAKSSYSIYLSQAFSLGGFVLLVQVTGLHGWMPFPIAIAVAMVFALACGVAVYYILEKPLVSVVKGLQGRAATPPKQILLRSDVTAAARAIPARAPTAN